MTKVNAPLFSFGASGAIAKSLVYFGWKGLDVVRSYVVPANPKTAAQTTQRGYLTTVVGLIHTAMADATHPLGNTDKSAYALLASLAANPRTWFNEASREGVDQYVAALHAVVFRDGVTTPGAAQLGISLRWSKEGANDVTAGTIYYGTSKSALLSTQAAAIAAGEITATLVGLVAGTKYFWQFRPTAHADYVGCNSGIYQGTPT